MIASEGVRESDDPTGLAGDELARWTDINYEVAKDPVVQGAAIHVLAIGRKP